MRPAWAEAQPERGSFNLSACSEVLLQDGTRQLNLRGMLTAPQSASQRIITNKFCDLSEQRYFDSFPFVRCSTSIES